MAPSSTDKPVVVGFISQLSQKYSSYSLIGFVVVLVVLLILVQSSRGTKAIANLPGPRGQPILGSLASLRGKVHAEQYRIWGQKYGDVFQVKLGERTAVIINSASAARSLFLGQREATKSRPLFYVLHGKVQGGSSTTSTTSSANLRDNEEEVI